MLPALILLASAILRIADPPLLEDARFKIFDTFQHLKPRSFEKTAVCVVDLNDESLKRLGQWPWPRTQVAKLIGRLYEADAAVVALDIVFSEPDRTSPSQAIAFWPAAPALEAAARELPDHDRLLAQTISNGNVVCGFVLSSEPNGQTPALKTGIAYGGDNPLLFVPRLSGAVVNLPELEKAAKGNGHFNILPERDGILRRVPLFLRLGDSLYPSLAAEALRVAQGTSTITVKSSEGSGETGGGAQTGIVAVKIGSFEIPTDEQGRVWIYDTGPAAARFVPAWTVFTGDFDRSLVEGKIVFIGSSAAGLKDIRATPLNPAAGGTEVHAQLIEQTLSSEFLHRPDWAPGAELLFLVATGIGLILLLPRLGPLWCALAGVLAVAGAYAGSWLAFTKNHWLLDPVFPSLTAVSIYLATSIIISWQTEMERRQVRQAFGRYLSPVLVKRLAEHPEQLRLGGELKTMTLLFLDIRRFTTLSEQFDAQGLTQFMNRFLTPMTNIILKHSGTIDKYIGDCIMAFWNAPLEDPEHARHACNAALEMRKTLIAWNKEQAAQAQSLGRSWMPVHIGIGINTGTCCVGNMGSDQRFDYSVLGDTVNLASRLESQSKTHGVDIILGDQSREQAGDYACLEIDLITVKGKTLPVRIYALLGDSLLNAENSFRELQAKHNRMLEAYRTQCWDDARRLIEECRKLETPALRLQALYALYRERIELYEANPPGKEWDGRFVATTK